jgi:hypothetical protein
MVMARMEELKVVPAGFDLATAQKAVAQKAVEVKGKFDFTEAITKGMGG